MERTKSLVRKFVICLFMENLSNSCSLPIGTDFDCNHGIEMRVSFTVNNRIYACLMVNCLSRAQLIG